MNSPEHVEQVERPGSQGLEPRSAAPPRAQEDAVRALWPDATAREVALGTIVVVGVGAAFWMVWRFQFVVFALVAAIFLHIALKPAVEALFRRGLGRRRGVVIVYALLLIAFLGLLLAIVPMLAAQASTFTQKLPDYYRLIRNFMLQSEVELLPRLGRLLPPAWDMAGVQRLVTQTVQSEEASPSTWLLLGDFGKNVFYAVAIFAMTLYITLDRDRLLYNLLIRLPLASRQEARGLVDEIEDKVGAFLRGQFILCAVVGTLSFAAYVIIGLPYAAALGALAFIFEAIPLIGPLLAAVAAGLVAATLGPDKLVWVLVASFAIQIAENNVLVPRIMDRAVGVNAIVSILAITAFTLLFGILGALLAIPMAAVLQVLIDRHLFAVGNRPGEADVETLTGLESGGTRSATDVLRLEAAELAQDVRKQARTSDASTSPEIDAIEDLIELTASDLVALLSPAQGAEVDGAPISQETISG